MVQFIYAIKVRGEERPLGIIAVATRIFIQTALNSQRDIHFILISCISKIVISPELTQA